MQGVYAILNLANNKKYIGSSVNVLTRKQDHFSSLARGDHHSYRLQKAYNKYGVENFKFIKLKEVKDENELRLAEQYYLDKYKTYLSRYGYNLALNAEGGATAKHRKAVLQFTFKGEKVGEYASIIEAIRALKPLYNLGGAISNACKGKYRFAHGYIWIYKKNFTYELLAKKLELANNPIKRSDETRLKQRNKKLGLKMSEEQKKNLSLALRGRSPKNLATIQKQKRKPVYVYSLTNIFIESFESITNCCKKYPGALAFLLSPPKKPRKYKFYYEKI